MQMPSTEAANTASVSALRSSSSRRSADERSSSDSTGMGCFASTRFSCSQPSCVVKPGPPRGESDSRGVIESPALGHLVKNFWESGPPRMARALLRLNAVSKNRDRSEHAEDEMDG